MIFVKQSAPLIGEAHNRFIGVAQPIEGLKGQILVRPGPLGLQWIDAPGGNKITRSVKVNLVPIVEMALTGHYRA